MNMLVDNLVDKIDIDGQIFDIDTDYRNCLKIILAWEDENLSNEEKVYITLNRLYDDNIPENVELAFKKALLFLNLGETSDENKKKTGKRLYSFTQDSNYIFSAVERVTGGKLSSGDKYHWWLFIMSLMEMPRDSFFNTIINLRDKKNRGKLDKEEKSYWKKNRDILELECELPELTDQEIENINKFRELEKKSELLKKQKLKEGVINGTS